MDTMVNAKLYALRQNRIQILAEEGYHIAQDSIIIYFCAYQRALLIVTSMEEDTKFWRQLRMVAGEYILYNNELKKLHVRKGSPTNRILRYEQRIKDVNILLKAIEVRIKENKGKDDRNKKE